MKTLIQFGGAVKALGGGRIAGYLVQYSDAENPDLSSHRDFFDVKTDFDMEDGKKASVYFHHGLDKTIDARKLGTVEMKATDVGIFVEGVLNLRDEYEQAIYKMAEKNALGWSSGATSHLVRREKVEGKNASHVTYWPISEASLTPTPADYRNQAIVPAESIAVKTFLEMTGASPAPDAKKDYVFVAESPYLGETLGQSMSYSALSDLADRLSWFTLELLGVEELSNPDKLRILGEAIDEFKATAISVVTALLGADPESTEAKSLHQALALGKGAGTVAAEIKKLPTKEYLTAMGTVVSDCERRLSWYDAERSIKQGRSISADNLASMNTIHDLMHSATGMIKGMIDKHTAPKANEPSSDSQIQTVNDSLNKEFSKFLYMRGHGGTLTL